MAKPKTSYSVSGHTSRRSAATPTEPAPTLLQPQRIKMMWFAVVITMVIIVGVWALTLFWGDFGRSSNQSPLRDIYEQVKGAFTDEAPPTPDFIPIDEGRLEDLRSRVFPEFTEPSPTP